MQLRWAIVAGLALGIGVAWWASREAPADAAGAAADPARADGQAPPAAVLYRWTDEAGVVHVTQDPPPRGRRYETVDIQPRDGIEVDGRRE